MVLLLACSHTNLDPGVSDRIKRLAQSDLDWKYLIDAASWHGVLPLLCYNLNRACADAVPPALLQEMQARFRINSARNLFLAGELLKILQFLQNNGISAVAFKGPLLAAMAYGNPALRQFYDLDVLVKEKDFPAAKHLFLAQGYQPWRELTAIEETRHFRSNHAFTLVRSVDGLRLDLHWRITQERYAFALDVESLWNRLTRTSFCGRDVLSLSPEDSLLVLCIHGSKHCWERLAWICDVAE
ncbi:MAG TPA: nucleotidyltransferase family protein, partial [Candidatus Udaeobacter sp.]|nr:nucleotidyltransferase family protein [Candidatus Udaeobacter sp.]